MTTAFYRLALSLTERIHQVVKASLRIFCNFEPNDWINVKPMAEFIYDDWEGKSIWLTPFSTNSGLNPHSNCLIDKSGTNPESQMFMDRMDRVDKLVSGKLAIT